MNFGLYVKYLLFLSDFWKINIKFYENPSSESHVVQCGRTDTQMQLAGSQTRGEVNSRFSQCKRVITCSLRLDNRHVTVAGRYEASWAAVTPGQLQLCSVLPCNLIFLAFHYHEQITDVNHQALKIMIKNLLFSGVALGILHVFLSV